MPQIEFHAAEVMPVGDVAVIITAAFTSDDYPKAEWFIIMPDEECTLYAGSFSVPLKSFNIPELELNEEFMLKEALNQAKIDLCSYLDEKSITVPYARQNVTKDSINVLVHLWIRGHCFEKLEEIKKKSKCELLQEKLDMVISLMTYPIKREKL